MLRSCISPVYATFSAAQPNTIEALGLQDEEGKKLEETETKVGAIISTPERPLAGASEYHLDRMFRWALITPLDITS